MRRIVLGSSGNRPPFTRAASVADYRFTMAYTEALLHHRCHEVPSRRSFFGCDDDRHAADWMARDCNEW
jgi:hypothetical protein